MGSRSEFDGALAASLDGDAIEIIGGPHAWGVATIVGSGLTVFGGTFTGDTAFDIQGGGNSNSLIRFNYLDENGPDSFLSNRVGHGNVFYGNYVGGASLGIYDNGSDNTYVYNLFQRHRAPAFGDIAVSLFAETPGMPPDSPPEPGSKSANIQRNVFGGFSSWLATVQQFGEVTVGPTGASMLDNVFVGTAGVDTEENYRPDGEAVDVPFKIWIAQNASENTTISSGEGPVYSGEEGLDLDSVTVEGVEYVAPPWWAQRRRF